MFKNIWLIIGITSSIISLYGKESLSLLAAIKSQSTVTLTIGSGPTTLLEVNPLFERILLTHPKELDPGFISHQTPLHARSTNPNGYYVNVQATNNIFIGPDQTFYMVRKDAPSLYRLAFTLLANKSPQGAPTPIHHQGFGPPQGGTPHLNNSKIINTEGKPDIEKKNYSLYFFILSEQIQIIPQGYYVCELILNLIET